MRLIVYLFIFPVGVYDPTVSQSVKIAHEYEELTDIFMKLRKHYQKRKKMVSIARSNTKITTLRLCL
jgi:hypothetical protein